jgi:hypothetical protein
LSSKQNFCGRPHLLCALADDLKATVLFGVGISFAALILVAALGQLGGVP